jgi:hypothetical protein
MPYFQIHANSLFPITNFFFKSFLTGKNNFLLIIIRDHKEFIINIFILYLSYLL